MSTNCSITVKVNDEKFYSVYCHFDGYPSHTFKILSNYYNSQEKAEDLVKMGDISFIDKSIECPYGHYFDNPVKGYSVFYKRDRGEDSCDPYITFSYEDVMRNNNQEWNYLWDGDKWVIK